MIEVLKPGPLALVEDAGRPGLAAVGVSPSGAFDRAAFADGARLVGNTAGHAAIEVTLGGLVVRSAAHHRVALTGAVCAATVNGLPVPWGEPVQLRPADVLALGLPTLGLRSYLSVAGGVDVPAVLGSRSTDLLSGIGPARLAAGDFLPIGVVTVPEETPERHEAPSPSTVLDLLPGPRTDWLADPDALAGTWTVSPESNRIGVRLTGPVLTRAAAFEGEELPSEPIVRGAVQLPPSGRPVLFGPDHPTTGGYPVVAVLTEAAGDRLAQCRPGERVRLAWVAPR
ncbi:MAG: biotin-dependent carboxyltransferase family protein [Actinobacteria bacterium]|nr:biotin-dependent carboxyltransferase family protein [Actinomycetota bacterium]